MKRQIANMLIVSGTFLFCLHLPGAYAAEQPSRTGNALETQTKDSKERIFSFEEQQISVKNFDPRGYILDIGGGGEGVVGHMKGEQVIAIDISKYELEEAPAGPLKIIMDARDLQFLDETFNTATSFFTLMYINGYDHRKVFDEIYRVLRRRGRFLIWDVNLEKRSQKDQDIFIIPLVVQLNEEEIRTRYGSRWPLEAHDISYYKRLAKEAGFQILSQEESGQVFFLELRKP